MDLLYLTLHQSAMVLFDSTLLHFALYLTLFVSLSFCHACTWLYLTQCHSVMDQLDSTLFYHGCCCLSTWVYFTMALFETTSLYFTWPWLHLTLRDSRLLSSTMALLTLPESSLSLLYLKQFDSTMALCDLSNYPFNLLDSTWLYYTMDHLDFT